MKKVELQATKTDIRFRYFSQHETHDHSEVHVQV